TKILISKSRIRAIFQSQNLFSATERRLIGSGASEAAAEQCPGLSALRLSNGRARHSVPAGTLASTAHRESLGEEARQAGLRDFLLRRREIVLYPQQFDQVVVDIVNAIRSAPVPVARLSDTAGVNEVFFAWLDPNVLAGLALDTFVANKRHRHMGVPEKTDCRALIRKTREGIEMIEHINPFSGRVERDV